MGTVANLVSGAGTVDISGDLGYTRGGCTMNCDETIVWVDVDQEIGAVDGILTDEVYTMKTNLAESTLANLEYAWDGTLVALVLSFGGGTLTELSNVSIAGVGQAAQPIRTVVFLKSISIERAEFSFVKDDITLVPITFRAIVDTTKAVGYKIGTVTDSGGV